MAAIYRAARRYRRKETINISPIDCQSCPSPPSTRRPRKARPSAGPPVPRRRDDRWWLASDTAACEVFVSGSRAGHGGGGPRAYLVRAIHGLLQSLDPGAADTALARVDGEGVVRGHKGGHGAGHYPGTRAGVTRVVECIAGLRQNIVLLLHFLCRCCCCRR